MNSVGECGRVIISNVDGMLAAMRSMDRIPWDEFKELASLELASIPDKDKKAFEEMFGRSWDSFSEFIMHRVGGGYSEINDTCSKLNSMGDLRAEDISGISMVETINCVWRSAKIEFWLVCKLLHTSDSS